MRNSGSKTNSWPRALLTIRRLGFFFSWLSVLGCVGIIGLYGIYRDDIPDITVPKNYRPSLKSQVFAQNGELIAEFGTKTRIVVPFNEIPSLLIKAFISSEDKNFYQHHGIDFTGVVNAVLQAISQERSVLRGASTLTQQLAKSMLVKKDGYEQGTARTIARKAKEAILARRLEMHLSKNEILWIYLNEIYLGDGSYGIAAAAKNYFQKDLKELTLNEMALIAGLAQAPSRLSPQVNINAAIARKEYVLSRMLEEKYIDQDAYDKAQLDTKNLIILKRENNFKKLAPYFSETIRRMVIDEFGEHQVYEDGLKIFTTLDVDQELLMQRVLRMGLLEIDKRQGYSGPIFRPRNQQEKKIAQEVVNIFNQEGSLDDYNVAIIERIDDDKQLIWINKGDGSHVISDDFLTWVRPRNPKDNYAQHSLSSLKNIFLVGDVVLVKKVSWPSIDNSDVKENNSVNPLYSLDQEPIIEGAMFAMEPHTGYVTALHGGYSFARSEFNRVFQACRQPGSLFKPIVMSAAIALKNYNPATFITDAPLTFYDAHGRSIWQPKNLGNIYRGKVTLREAIIKSMNIPTLNVMADVGVGPVIEWAKKLGIGTKLKFELGTAIGSSCVTPFEIGKVFATFANMGVSVDPVLIKEIKDRENNRIKFHGKSRDPYILRKDRVFIHIDDALNKKTPVMKKEHAYTINYLLSEVFRHGTASNSDVTLRNIAGKTGTTNDSFDVWFAGYTKNLLSLVWVGNDSMDVPLGVYEQGGRTALPLFSEFMNEATKDHNDRDWPMPDTLCWANIDLASGLRVQDDAPLSFTAPFSCSDLPDYLELAEQNSSGSTSNQEI